MGASVARRLPAGSSRPSPSGPADSRRKSTVAYIRAGAAGASPVSGAQPARARHGRSPLWTTMDSMSGTRPSASTAPLSRSPDSIRCRYSRIRHAMSISV